MNTFFSCASPSSGFRQHQSITNEIFAALNELDEGDDYIDDLTVHIVTNASISMHLGSNGYCDSNNDSEDDDLHYFDFEDQFYGAHNEVSEVRTGLTPDFQDCGFGHYASKRWEEVKDLVPEIESLPIDRSIASSLPCDRETQDIVSRGWNVPLEDMDQRSLQMAVASHLRRNGVDPVFALNYDNPHAYGTTVVARLKVGPCSLRDFVDESELDPVFTSGPQFDAFTHVGYGMDRMCRKLDLGIPESSHSQVPCGMNCALVDVPGGKTVPGLRREPLRGQHISAANVAYKFNYDWYLLNGEGIWSTWYDVFLKYAGILTNERNISEIMKVVVKRELQFNKLFKQGEFFGNPDISKYFEDLLDILIHPNLARWGLFNKSDKHLLLHFSNAFKIKNLACFVGRYVFWPYMINLLKEILPALVRVYGPIALVVNCTTPWFLNIIAQHPLVTIHLSIDSALTSVGNNVIWFMCDVTSRIVKEAMTKFNYVIVRRMLKTCTTHGVPHYSNHSFIPLEDRSITYTALPFTPMVDGSYYVIQSKFNSKIMEFQAAKKISVFDEFAYRHYVLTVMSLVVILRNSGSLSVLVDHLKPLEKFHTRTKIVYPDLNLRFERYFFGSQGYVFPLNGYVLWAQHIDRYDYDSVVRSVVRDFHKLTRYKSSTHSKSETTAIAKRERIILEMRTPYFYRNDMRYLLSQVQWTDASIRAWAYHKYCSSVSSPQMMHHLNSHDEDVRRQEGLNSLFFPYPLSPTQQYHYAEHAYSLVKYSGLTSMFGFNGDQVFPGVDEPVDTSVIDEDADDDESTSDSDTGENKEYRLKGIKSGIFVRREDGKFEHIITKYVLEEAE